MFKLLQRRPRQPPFDERLANDLLAVFTGRGKPSECEMVFGWLMMELKLWGALESEEDVVLHNKAVDILAKMGLQDIVAMKRNGTLKFEINFPEPQNMGPGVRDIEVDRT